jgi:alkylhydroperoxidase family enzyme
MEEYHALLQSLFGETLPEHASVLNVQRTWARHPALMKAQRPYQQHLVADSTLPRRDHEMAVLRIGWHCRSEYEFSQHTVFGRRAGLTDAEIKRITEGPDAEGWTSFEATLLRAVDELYHDAFIADATWATLSERYDVPQLMDFIVLVGRYWTVSVVLNSLGVQLEAGKPRFPG